MQVIPLPPNAPHQTMGHSHPNSRIPMPVILRILLTTNSDNNAEKTKPMRSNSNCTSSHKKWMESEVVDSKLNGGVCV